MIITWHVVGKKRQEKVWTGLEFSDTTRLYGRIFWMYQYFMPFINLLVFTAVVCYHSGSRRNTRISLTSHPVLAEQRVSGYNSARSSSITNDDSEICTVCSHTGCSHIIPASCRCQSRSRGATGTGWDEEKNSFFLFNSAGVNLQLNSAKTFGDERGTWSPNIEMDDGEHCSGLSCGVGSQIKESAHWQSFSLFINQIHRNEHVRLCAPGRVCGRRWMSGGGESGSGWEMKRLGVVTSCCFFFHIADGQGPAVNKL